MNHPLFGLMNGAIKAKIGLVPQNVIWGGKVPLLTLHITPDISKFEESKLLEMIIMVYLCYVVYIGNVITNNVLTDYSYYTNTDKGC